MPWGEDDVARFSKAAAANPKTRRQWVDVANGALSRGAEEASAIKQANAVAGRRISPKQLAYVMKAGKKKSNG